MCLCPSGSHRTGAKLSRVPDAGPVLSPHRGLLHATSPRSYPIGCKTQIPQMHAVTVVKVARK